MTQAQDTWTPKWLDWAATAFLLLVAMPMKGTHLVGGEMYYDYVGGNDYEVHLIVYRDCGPTNTNGTGFDLASALGVYAGEELIATEAMELDFNLVTNIDLLSGSPCAMLPPGVCLERAEYITTLTLPPSDQAYTLVYQRCCRNPQIVNLQDAMNTGFTMFAEVPPTTGDESIAESNSSPRFTEVPQAYVCQGQPFSLNHLAVDPDGDSLLFTIGDVFLGGTFTAPIPNPPVPPPFPNVTWASGYEPTAPLGSETSEILSINPNNGTLIATPSATGKYVIGIVVTEFRQDESGNWMELGSILRDFTIDVVQCGIVVPDVVWPEPCSGLVVSFDAEADAGSFQWSFGSGSSEDTSSEPAPTHTYSEPGLYPVSLIYDLGGCSDSVAIELAVSQPPEASFALGQITCDAEHWIQPATFTGNTSNVDAITWSLDGTPVATEANPEAFVVPPGLHSISTTVTNEFGCTSSEEQTVTFPDMPHAALTMAEPPCNGLDIAFINLSENANAYAWLFDVDEPWTGLLEEGEPSDPTWTYGGFGTYFAQLIAQPGAACADTAILEVTVLPQDPLVMAFAALEPLACSMETSVEFFFFGENADAVLWDFGTAGSASGDTIQFDFFESGLHSVSLTIENDTCGTTQTEEFDVFIPELVADVDLVVPNVMTPNADGKNDRFRVGVRRTDETLDPAGMSTFSRFKVQILDRWGVVVHESEGIGAAWDGRIGGRPAAPGTYYYILEADHSCLDEPLQEMGEVTLIHD